MKILITGATGFIGSHLVEYLSHKHKIHGLSHKKKIKNHFNISLSDKKRINDLIKKNKYDVVIHLGATLEEKEPFLMFKENCQSTINLIDSCAKNKVKKFIFLSSHLVYGETQYLPIDENHVTDPSTNYGFSKLINETICKMYVKSYKIDVVILRLTSVYGPSQPHKYVIPTMISNGIKKNSLVINEFANGFQLMDLIHVQEVCKAIFLACKSKRNFGVYNIASGQSINAEDIAKILSKIIKINFIRRRKFNKKTNHFLYDVTKAKKELEFRSTIKINKKTLTHIYEKMVN